MGECKELFKRIIHIMGCVGVKSCRWPSFTSRCYSGAAGDTHSVTFCTVITLALSMKKISFSHRQEAEVQSTVKNEIRPQQKHHWEGKTPTTNE